ncbi:hypothetical protein BJ878DRAFT_478405 [Calycina marina]|uniref:Uncharacterized protein n=1 Tax=Calycina marina TaxID=1763456 RepID=A0A9P7Z6T3_9HELO|nr:hypothetical protein BJ878DRAFT_478405 [Calycina marina]
MEEHKQAQRPAINFSHIVYDVDTAEHPVASQIPQPSLKQSTVGNPDIFRPLFYQQGGPTSLNDYLMNNIPQIGLHAVSFNDKTVIIIYWLHTLMEAIGKLDFLIVWTLMLQGRDNVVPVPCATLSDPLAILAKGPIQSHKLTHHVLSIFGLGLFILRNVFDFWKLTNRILCVPGALITKLRNEALEDLVADGIEDAFMSEDDVLYTCGLATPSCAVQFVLRAKGST